MALEDTGLRRRALVKSGVSEEEDTDKDLSKSGSLRSQYLLVLATAQRDDDVVEYTIKQLQSRGLSCQRVLSDKTNSILVSASFNLLAKQAEQLQWKRELKNSKEVLKFTVKHLSHFVPSDGEDFFTTAEELQLLHHCIESTPYEYNVFKKHGHKVDKDDKGFLWSLLNSSPPVVTEAYPLHNKNEIGKLSKMLHWSFVPFSGFDVNTIRNYFGEDVAYYFGWMNFYHTCGFIPALAGVAMYLYRWFRGATVDTDPYLPFFSVFMAIWGVLFLVLWQRRSAVHSFEWNTYSYSARDELRPEFHGTMSPHPVTGKLALYYPSWKRRLWYVFSFLAMLPLLALGVVVMTFSLNLNGYIKNTSSPIYVEMLARFARPGGLFAADSPYYLWLVPTLAHSIVVNFINQLYSRVAEQCTDLENHRTTHAWHSSLVIKRVFFECLDCFMPLFYIAFYQLDVITLRAEIVSLFTSDEIRRVTMETVIPFIKEMFVTCVSKTDRLSDSVKAEYEPFDDYLEMVIQFGYITLFASAFPLGAAVTLVFLYIEVRSDIFKLLYAYRRPIPRRSSGIGVWYDVMSMMVFIAILTNSAILGFSSEQLMQWLPYLFTRDTAGGDQVMALGSGRYVVGIVVVFEHLLLLVAILLMKSINPVPKWVRIAIDRRKYLSQQRLKQQGATASDLVETMK